MKIRVYDYGVMLIDGDQEVPLTIEMKEYKDVVELLQGKGKLEFMSSIATDGKDPAEVVGLDESAIFTIADYRIVIVSSEVFIELVESLGIHESDEVVSITKKLFREKMSENYEATRNKLLQILRSLVEKN